MYQVSEVSAVLVTGDVWTRLKRHKTKLVYRLNSTVLAICTVHMYYVLLIIRFGLGLSDKSPTLPPPTPFANTYEGLVLVWSTSLNTRPEYVFTCSSPITAVKFHPTEPHLIVGGSKSGQLFVWDTRAGRLPVQKSVMYGNAHSCPICALENVEVCFFSLFIDIM